MSLTAVRLLFTRISRIKVSLFSLVIAASILHGLSGILGQDEVSAEVSDVRPHISSLLRLSRVIGVFDLFL